MVGLFLTELVADAATLTRATPINMPRSYSGRLHQERLTARKEGRISTSIRLSKERMVSILCLAKLALTNFPDFSNIRSVCGETTVTLGNSWCGYAILAQMILNEAVSRTARSTSDSFSKLPLAERLHRRLGKILFANAQVGFFAME